MARKKGMNNRKRDVKKKKIYLFLEGSENCSEHLYISKYIDLFKNKKAIDIEFFPHACGDGSWKNIVRNINREIKNKKHSNIEIWCVLDKDKNDLDFIQLECLKERYRLIFSNKCFELWLLYHYFSFDQIEGCSIKKYITKLEKRTGHKYEKCKGIDVSRKERKTAVQNSKVRHKLYMREGTPLNEAYNCTNFYEILEEIEKAFRDYVLK